MRGQRLGIALAAALGLALLMLSAASARAHQAGRYGGTLVVGLSGGNPATLDPILNGGGQAIEVYLAMCQRLYGVVSNHGRLEDAPMLAATKPVPSKDKLTYTIKLRPGIRFNDGTPFNAQ